MIPVWMSVVLGAVGVLGLFLVTMKLAAGFVVGFFVQFLWIAYAVHTKQWGFIPMSCAYGAVNLRGWIVWRRQKMSSAEACSSEGKP